MEINSEIRSYVKDALIDIIANEKEIFFDAFSEIIEDIAFGKHIDAADVGDYVDEELVLQTLKEIK